MTAINNKVILNSFQDLPRTAVVVSLRNSVAWKMPNQVWHDGPFLFLRAEHFLPNQKPRWGIGVFDSQGHYFLGVPFQGVALTLKLTT
jgi:hypothetical protein